MRTLLRSAHLVCVTIYVGATFVGFPVGHLHGWLWSVVLSGAAMMATDLYRSGEFLREARGLAMLAKIGVLVIAHSSPGLLRPLLVFVVFASGIVSHMPGRYRHWSLGNGEPDVGQRRAGRG